MSAETLNSLEAPRPTIMVLGKNIGEEWTGERIRVTPGHLSPWGETGSDGAGIAIEDGDAEIAAFTVTNTAGSKPLTPHEALLSRDYDRAGEPPKAEAVYMAERFEMNYPHLAGRDFIQPNSWDTNRDAKETRKLIEEGKLDPENWILATIGFHLSRAVMLFRRAGVKVYHEIPTEELVGRRDPTAERLIKGSELYKKEEAKERKVRIVQSLPFAADTISMLTKRSRTR